MLSPANYHLSVPRGRRDNLRFRKHVLQQAQSNPALQAGLIEACRLDILFYINTFVWQVNPRHKGQEAGPFVTWDFQEASIRTILDHIESDVDLLIEKSREMGASWLCLIVMDWLAMFDSWKKFLCISHSEAAVDRAEDPDSLFWKVKFMHDHLPDWLRRGQGKKRKMGFSYPATNSSLNGASSTGRSGVGGRATAVFLDEFSKQEDDFAILGQTADTGCRIFNGTHYGIGSAFYQLTQRPDLHKLVMHWSQHPDKNKGLYRYDPESNGVECLDKSYQYPADFCFVMDGTPSGGPFPCLRSPWYDAECIRRANARDVAMHLDINPSGSSAQFFDAGTINSLKRTYAQEPVWEGDLFYDKDAGKPSELIRREGGDLKLWIMPNARGLIPPSQYCMGGDIAAGTGATPSCLSVLNERTGEKVLEFANAFIDPIDFASLAVAVCWLFKDEDEMGARFCWEMQGPGVKFGMRVVELGYRNIYWRKNENVLGLSNGKADQPGWYPSPSNKLMVLTDYRSALATRRFINRSAKALDECLDFVYDAKGMVDHGGIRSKNDPTGAGINHGDRVVADALACKMSRSATNQLAAMEEKNEQPKPGTLAFRRQLQENARKQEVWS